MHDRASGRSRIDGPIPEADGVHRLRGSRGRAVPDRVPSVPASLREQGGRQGVPGVQARALPRGHVPGALGQFRRGSRQVTPRRSTCPKTKKLAELKAGARAVVRHVSGEPELLRRLLELGFVPGTPITLVRR
ncbi:MAG: hypothetical protein E6K71_01755, partial [Candidatus Eisenbacteria bacterium]